MVDTNRIPKTGLTAAAVVACASALLSGCLAGPTYGTGKGSNVQLVEDVTSILSLGNRDQEQIAYTPRPELVTPGSTEVLPTPQASARVNNPSWPESPEETRERIRADATENQETVGYLPDGLTVASAKRRRGQSEYEQRIYGQGSPDMSGQTNRGAQREEVNRRLREQRQGDPNTRRYLSEPPTAYRQPAASAPSDDIGVDERTKEREARKAAGAGRSWRDLVPWL